MVWILFTIGLSVQFAGCAFHQCQRKHLKISAKYEIQESDFKPLFTMEQNTSGTLFHNCLNQCENFQHCIGLEVCNVGESLYRCRGCCEWRKRKVYSSSPGSSKCTYFEKYINFGANIALNKTATLSAQYDSITASSNAVDGITVCPSIEFVAASSFTRDSWLSIQLESTYSIRMVVIYARTDWHAYEADHTRVIVSGDNFNYPCGGEYPGPTQENDVIDFLCAAGTVGSNITIHKRPPHDEHLTVCEVEVFGNLYP
ncbi:uncharacterized protein LOC111108765 isoform X1 [Crassostrea virginica]